MMRFFLAITLRNTQRKNSKKWGYVSAPYSKQD